MTIDAEALRTLPAPPGRHGLPLVGETLAFLRDPFTFISDRVAAHGPIFRTHLLGAPTVILSGGETAGAFADEALCMRDGSIPSHVRELFGGRSLGLLDGAEHRARKRQILAGFLPEVLPAYLPGMQDCVESALGRWTGREIAGIAELKRLAMTVIARNVVSMEPGADLDALLEHFDALTAGFTGLPVALPGTAFTKALRARDSIFAILGRVVAEHRAAPSADGESARSAARSTPDDGLARMLAQPDDEGGLMSDANAVMELHHVFIAGYIVFAELAAMLVELAHGPELRGRLAAEVAEVSPHGPITPSQLAGAKLLWRTVQETKRVTPVVPLAFGKAKTTFALGGFRIQEGTRLYWAAYAHNQDARVYPAPATFDPERFAPGRAEHERHAHAFAPQGMGPATGHKCPGTDYATVLMQVFGIVLLRDHAWTLPEQDLSLDLARIPPEPRSGLRVAFERRGPDARPAPVSIARPPRAQYAPAPSERLGRDALLALAEIARADGRTAPEEVDALVRIARAYGAGETEAADVARAAREGVPARGPLALGPADAELLYTLGCLVAAADGSIDDAERSAVSALGDAVGLDAAGRARAAAAARAVAEALGAGGGALAALARALDSDTWR